MPADMHISQITGYGHFRHFKEFLKFKGLIQFRSSERLQTWIRIIIITVMMLVLSRYALHTDPSGGSSTGIAETLFIWFYMDMAIILMWYRNGMLIEMRHLLPFPLSCPLLLMFQLSQLLADSKNILFVVPFGILVVKILSVGIFTALLALIFFILIFVNLQIWMLNIYLIFIRQFELFRNNIMILLLVLIALARALAEAGISPESMAAPVTAWMAAGESPLNQSALPVGVLTILLGAGVAAGSWLIPRREYR